MFCFVKCHFESRFGIGTFITTIYGLGLLLERIYQSDIHFQELLNLYLPDENETYNSSVDYDDEQKFEVLMLE